MTNVPHSALAAIQEYFHGMLSAKAGGLIRKHSLDLPDLSAFSSTAETNGHFPIPGMHGGFNYWLEGEGDQVALIVLCFSRIVGGSELFYYLTPAGCQLIENEELRHRVRLWLQTGSPVLDAAERKALAEHARTSASVRAAMAKQFGPIPGVAGKPPRSQQYQHLRSYQGQKAVYRSTGVLLPVTINFVIVGERMLEAFLSPLRSPLVRWHNAPELFEPFDISAVWGEVRIDQDEWSAPQIGWKLFVNPASCDAVLRLAAAEPDLPIPALFMLADVLAQWPDRAAPIPERIREAALASSCFPLGYKAEQGSGMP